jgi:hypothetical protein
MSAATARAGSLFAGAGFIHRQRPAIERFAVHSLDGGIGGFLALHRDKAEAPGPAAEFIHDKIRLDDIAERGERFLKLALSDVVGKIPDKQFRIHVDVALSNRPSRLFPNAGSKYQ